MSLSFSSRFVGWAVLGLGLAVVHCSSSGERPPGSNNGASGGFGPGEPSDDFELDLGTGGGAGPGGGFLHPLCRGGSPSDCIPDDPLSCDFLEANGLGGEGGADNPGAPGGFGGLGGAAGSNGGEGTGSGGLDGVGGLAGGGGSSGGEPESDQACHLVMEEGSVARSCGPAGVGGQDAPCLFPSHCAPGLTCVGEGESGLCRPYCCSGDHASCGAETYCAPRRVVGSSSDLVAPVCVRADQCKLTEEYPCLQGTTCQCAEGTACVPVRSDGTTSCIVPGAGLKGDPCDGPFACSYGHVCSQSRGCLELCSTVSTRAQCAEGEYCQALSGFPDDVGVCISR